MGSRKIVLFLIIILILASGTIVLSIILRQKGVSFTPKTQVSNESSPSAQTAIGSSLYNFAGTINNISGNKLTVETLVGDEKLPPQVSPPKMKNVTIIVTENTEITSPQAGGSFRKLSLQELKKDLRINIYTKAGISYSDEIPALKIVVMNTSASAMPPE